MESEPLGEAKRYRSYYDKLSFVYREYDENLKLLGLSELSSEYTREIKRQKTISFMEPLDGKLILDIGCGQGVLLSKISERIKLGVGVDISRNIFPKTGQRFELAQADGCSLPFVDACFDRVVAMELIEHLYPQWKVRMLEEISRVLKEDGRLVVTTPRRKGFLTLLLASFFTAIDFVYCLFNLRVKKYWTSRLKSHKAASKKYGMREHIKEYGRRELVSLLGEAGFTVHAWSGSTISPYLSPSLGIFLRANEFAPKFFRFWKKLSEFLTRHVPSKSYWDIIVVCGKVRKA
jgi:ubiquinone/menaquinone biosynthesis C-methylase UbiE